jgi:hypothetical protein
MKLKLIWKASTISLALLTAPAMLSAQMADPPETPAVPDIPMPPGPPATPLPPVEVPAPPAMPDLPPEHIAKLGTVPGTQVAYPPCSSVLQDQCTNTRPEADVKAIRHTVKAKRRPHRTHSS